MEFYADKMKSEETRRHNTCITQYPQNFRGLTRRMKFPSLPNSP